MRLPRIQGVIDRRILVNYRVSPEVIARVLPPPFRPQLVRGWAIAGICLIRLKQVRPAFLSLPIGGSSENAAHRIAVEWEQDGELRHGVYIPRRDTNSKFNALVGGRLFPGVHHYAKFQVAEIDECLSIAIDSDDRQVHVSVVSQVTDQLPNGSVFGSVAEASDFFQQGSLGYSATRDAGRYDGLELCCKTWQVTPLQVEHLESSFFADRQTFPEGSVLFDCALLMRGIEHQWHSREDICCETAEKSRKIVVAMEQTGSGR